MQFVRTQIYLEPQQHQYLKDEAHRRGMSLAKLLRQLVDDAVGTPHRGGDLTGLIGLGRSRGGDIGSHKDEYIAQAIEQHRRGTARPRGR